MIQLEDSFVATLNAMKQRLPHATLLVGPRGRGLHTTARYMAEQWGTLLEEIVPTSPSGSNTLSISAETVRRLYSRTAGKATTPQVVVIDDADKMTLTAQNALLKLLEEPAPNIHFILTSHRPETLVATIRSRAQTLMVPALSAGASLQLVKGLGVKEADKQRQILYMASGNPAEIYRLATNEAYFANFLDKMDKIKAFVSGSKYEKLCVVNTLKDDRLACLEFIELLVQILRRSVAKQPERATMQWIDKLLDAYEAIAANGNIRLQMTASVV